jgi:proline iminopeptidase
MPKPRSAQNVIEEAYLVGGLDCCPRQGWRTYLFNSHIWWMTKAPRLFIHSHCRHRLSANPNLGSKCNVRTCIPSNFVSKSHIQLQIRVLACFQLAVKHCKLAALFIRMVWSHCMFKISPLKLLSPKLTCALVLLPILAQPILAASVTSDPTAMAVSPAAEQQLVSTSGMAEGVFYQTFGSGKPVLIINGGPGLDSAGFETIAKAIAAKGYQTILFDQRGTGRSPLPEINGSTIQMGLMVDDIETLRRHLKQPKLTIFGHSFGGMLGGAYAAKYPQHVEKLIFSSAGGLDLSFRDQFAKRFNANLTAAEQTKMQVYQDRQAAGDDSDDTRDALALIRAHAYVLDKNKAPAIAARLKVVNMQINSLVYEDLERINFDLKSSFQEFKAPVIVLQGENDVISVDTAKSIANSFKQARLVIMPNCAHYGWLDSPALYYASIFEFLKA